MENNDGQETEALCTECGHAFKTYMDRVLKDGTNLGEKKDINCPVCGCGECKISQ